MIQMLPEFHIAMSSCGDMEITLHLVSVQTSKNPATVNRSLHSWRLWELLPLARSTQLIMHIPQLLPPGFSILADSQRMHALGALPLLPARWVLAQHLASERPVARRILHIDVQISAAHGDYDVDVDLHVMRDTFFDGEGLRRCAGEPAPDLRPREVDAGQNEEDGK